MASKIPPFLLNQSSSVFLQKDKERLKISFIEKGIHHLAIMIKKGYAHWELSSQNGLFQRIDARIKILFLLSFIITISLKKDFLSEIYIWIFIFALVLFSRLNLVMFYRRVLFLGFIFGFLIALPSAFNVITKGEMILSIVKLSRHYHFWVYHIPADIGVTKEGVFGVAMLTLRVINSLSLSFLVLYTTPFSEIVRALKVLKIPDSFLIILTLCYRYIFIFSKTIEEMHLAQKSKIVQEISNKRAREWIAGRIAFIFRKTHMRCEEVFKAMIGRGFSDTIKLYGFEKMRPADWFSGVFLLSMELLFLLI